MIWNRPQNSAALAWTAFACCACLVVGAMLWLTRSVVNTEHDRAQAEIRAELQERVRLSLWRLDSLGASILLEENSIPPHLFLSNPDTTLPTLARFETPDGAAIKGIGNDEALARCTSLLPGLVSVSNKKQQREEQADDDILELEPPEKESSVKDEVPVPQTKIRGGQEAQIAANAIEAANRNKWLSEAISKQNLGYGYQADSSKVEELAESSAPHPSAQPTPSALEINNPISEFKPMWFEGSLLLIRRGMTITSFAQGSLIDEEVLKQSLLQEALRLLPNASLNKPATGTDDSLILASFPLQLSAGDIGIAPDSIPQSIAYSLLAGWLAAVAALLTAYFLISNVMKLSERRASFVSAVTHELRTPLTTFRLYSDMLSSGAVREEKKPLYLGVLSREADRLSHLVENVLAFSQIERGSARSKVTEIEIGEFLETMRERFESRLDTASLRLEIKDIPSVRCTLDTSALEHILFNLIDNAAKYAVDSEPPVVTIEIIKIRRGMEIHISDHGPGIPESECRRIFRSFHKSAEQAAETKPGIGLGLALSKRLARTMGGSLTCRKRSDGKSGAVFILVLPVL